MKITKQGMKIYELIQQSNGHMTAEEILIVLKDLKVSIGIATIYRNLNNLFNAGLINRVRHPELGYIYDKNIHQHYHFYDTETNEIYDLNIKYQKELDEIVEKQLGGKVNKHSIIFEGTINKTNKKIHNK